MTRKMICEAMMNDIIRRFGFEDDRTIKFCFAVERNHSLTVIKKLYQRLINEEF